MTNDENTQEVGLDETKNNEEVETKVETEEETSDQSENSKETKDWKAEAEKWRAEAFKHKNQNKPDKASKKSNDLDYGEKAFLYAHDLKIKGEKETELVKNFMKETGKNLEQVLDSKYFQAELNEMRELQRTADATIKGKDSKGIKIDSIEYWAGKDFKDVPKEFKAKVIEYKLQNDKSKNVFYNS